MQIRHGNRSGSSGMQNKLDEVFTVSSDIFENYGGLEFKTTFCYCKQ